MRPFYVVAPTQPGAVIDRKVLKNVTRILWAMGHKWAEVHVNADA